jgi:hypothetical protein
LPEEAGSRPEGDDSHSDAGHDLLRGVERVAVDMQPVAADADDHGDREVEQEQEQEPEHWPGGKRLQEGLLRDRDR